MRVASFFLLGECLVAIGARGQASLRIYPEEGFLLPQKLGKRWDVVNCPALIEGQKMIRKLCADYVASAL